MLCTVWERRILSTPKWLVCLSTYVSVLAESGPPHWRPLPAPFWQLVAFVLTQPWKKTGDADIGYAGKYVDGRHEIACWRRKANVGGGREGGWWISLPRCLIHFGSNRDSIIWSQAFPGNRRRFTGARASQQWWCMERFLVSEHAGHQTVPKYVLQRPDIEPGSPAWQATRRSPFFVLSTFWLANADTGQRRRPQGHG